MFPEVLGNNIDCTSIDKMCTFHGVKEWDEWQVSISKKTGTALSKAALKKKKKKKGQSKTN